MLRFWNEWHAVWVLTIDVSEVRELAVTPLSRWDVERALEDAEMAANRATTRRPLAGADLTAAQVLRCERSAKNSQFTGFSGRFCRKLRGDRLLVG
jgi:hypothetical protein